MEGLESRLGRFPHFSVHHVAMSMLLYEYSPLAAWNVVAAKKAEL